MNPTFKTKFLIHLNQNKQQRNEEGFTLIELLVVIIIIGILAAIALPSFLSQANKAKQSEAKQYASSVNKAQQAVYTEKGFFITQTDQNAWNSLGVGIKTQTVNYKYELKGDSSSSVVLATKIPAALKSYAGTVGLVGPVGADKTSQAVVCETKSPNDAPISATVSTDKIECTGVMQDL